MSGELVVEPDHDEVLGQSLEERRAENERLQAENDHYAEALHRLADEDTWVLDEGLGGGAQEELHVRASLAKQALGQEVDCCTECMVSLGIEPDDE